MKFLIVDENKSFREYLRELIVDNNDECMELEDGLNIAAAFRKYKPDWLLIDLQMQKQNGFRLAEMMISEFRDASIALLSDFNDERLRIRAEQIGAKAFIVKENLCDLFKINIERKEQ
ncbi:MAG: response regulator [Bacteroidota bacterium]